MERRLNKEEVSKVLGISVRTLERRLKDKNNLIPYHVIGKRKYFLMSEVLTTTKAVIDKEEVLNMLEELLDYNCLYNGGNVCSSDGIKDVIRFIKGELK